MEKLEHALNKLNDHSGKLIGNLHEKKKLKNLKSQRKFIIKKK